MLRAKKMLVKATSKCKKRKITMLRLILAKKGLVSVSGRDVIVIYHLD